MGEFGQGVEKAEAVFGGGGQVGTDGGELAGAGEGAQAPGDFLPDFDHADLALGSVVIEGHAGVEGEP